MSAMQLQYDGDSDGNRTNDERNHGGSIPSCSLKTLNQLLHFPNLNILLGLVGLRGAHDEQKGQ